MKGNMNHKIIITSIAALCITLVCLIAFSFFLPAKKNADGNFGFMLARPAFAQESTAFPADEAGISAYVNVGQSIDINKVESTLRGVEAEGSNYVIGIMELPGLPEEEFPHLYITNDGWILAYYSKFAPASRIFQWYGYEGGPITTTTLQDAIAKMCRMIGVGYTITQSDVSYYHFNYPEATNMTVATDIAYGRSGDGTEDDNFTYSIPYGLTLNVTSYSHFSDWTTSSNAGTSWMDIDEKNLSTHSWHAGGLNNFLTCNNIAEDSYIIPNKAHVVRIHHSSWGGTLTGIAIVFIYR